MDCKKKQLPLKDPEKKDLSSPFSPVAQKPGLDASQVEFSLAEPWTPGELDPPPCPSWHLLPSTLPARSFFPKCTVPPTDHHWDRPHCYLCHVPPFPFPPTQYFPAWLAYLKASSQTSVLILTDSAKLASFFCPTLTAPPKPQP